MGLISETLLTPLPEYRCNKKKIVRNIWIGTYESLIYHDYFIDNNYDHFIITYFIESSKIMWELRIWKSFLSFEIIFRPCSSLYFVWFWNYWKFKLASYFGPLICMILIDKRKLENGHEMDFAFEKRKILICDNVQ